MKNKKIFIAVIIAILLALVVATVIIIAIKTNKQKNIDNSIDLEELENNFNSIFVNKMDPEDNADVMYLAYNINKEETSKYKISAQIPNIVINTSTTDIINKDIFNTFVKTIVEIMRQANKYTIYTIDYVSYLNNDILSIAIRCKVKEGANPQRTIIKTYNYDMKNDKLLSLQDIIDLKNLDKKEVQANILNKVEKEIKNSQNIENTGYNVYKRNLEDNMYKVENTSEYFLGTQNVLYILYPYGNSNYTSEMDLIICK